MKVMIVEDHVAMRRLLMNVILLNTKELVEFIECESGEEAIAAYKTNHPDCVLMDIELKSMSGFDVVRAINEQDPLAKVIMVTSYDTPTFRRKASKLKVQGFVSKEALTEVNEILSTIYSK